MRKLEIAEILSFNEGEIKKFEKEKELILSEDFKSFLKKYHAGYLEKDQCFDIANSKNNAPYFLD